MSFSSILNSSHINNYPKPPPGPCNSCSCFSRPPLLFSKLLESHASSMDCISSGPIHSQPTAVWLLPPSLIETSLAEAFNVLHTAFCFLSCIGYCAPLSLSRVLPLLPWLPRHSSGCPTSPDAFLSFCSLILWSANKPPSSVLRSHFTLHSTLPWETVFVQLPFPPVPGCLADVYLQLSSFFWLPDAYI